MQFLPASLYPLCEEILLHRKKEGKPLFSLKHIYCGPVVLPGCIVSPEEALGLVPDGPCALGPSELLWFAFGFGLVFDSVLLFPPGPVTPGPAAPGP